jgi:hypothetical protein
VRSPHCGEIEILSHGKGAVSCLPIRSKVAIIGATPNYEEAPFDDPSWEIWGCNSLWRCCSDSEGLFRGDRWFEMHPMEVQTAEELELIQRCPIPIYTLKDETSHAPNSVRFPLEKLQKLFPREYYTCTFAYQIALAIAEGFSEIGLFGCELGYGTPRERLVEKPCVEFWLGVAWARGITIHLPDNSGLASHKYPYGYDYDDELAYIDQQVSAFVKVRDEEVATKYGMRGYR